MSVGNERVSIEPWARARWTVKIAAATEPRGRERINGAKGMSDMAGNAALGSGRAQRELPRYIGVNGTSDIEGKAAR